MSKYLELAKKLKTLAEKGVGGERVNAEYQLKKLMAKYKFTPEDIESEELVFHDFKVPSDLKRLFRQITSSVLGLGYDIYTNKYKRGYLILKTTDADALEIHAKFDFYQKAYIDELDIFYSAFVSVNNLYPKNGPNRNMSELTIEEQQRALKAGMMAMGIEKRDFLKQLT